MNSGRQGSVCCGALRRSGRPEITETESKNGGNKDKMKQIWKPGNMIYPVPAVLVTVPTPDGKGNILTIAWTGTICTNPAMTYISVRPERYSYPFLRESGEFVINLTNEKLVRAADYCGVRSGRDVDKFAECHLTRETAEHVSAPMIAESPVNIECRVREVHEYGSHHMFAADVLAVHADEQYMDENGRFDLGLANLITYSHGEYYSLGKKLGTFGYSIKKKKAKEKARDNVQAKKKGEKK